MLKGRYTDKILTPKLSTHNIMALLWRSSISLFKTIEILKLRQKAFNLLLIKRRYLFLGSWHIIYKLIGNALEMDILHFVMLFFSDDELPLNLQEQLDKMMAFVFGIEAKIVDQAKMIDHLQFTKSFTSRSEKCMCTLSALFHFAWLLY